MEAFQIPGIVVIRVFQLGFLERPYLIWSRRAGGRWLIEGGRKEKRGGSVREMKDGGKKGGREIERERERERQN